MGAALENCGGGGGGGEAAMGMHLLLTEHCSGGSLMDAQCHL